MFFERLSTIFRHYRLTLAMTATLVILGALGFAFIPKEEDPHLSNRYGTLTVVYPGADAEKIQSSVIVPLEKKLQTVSGIKITETTIRSQFSYIYIELKDDTKNIDKEWDQIERVLTDYRSKLPQGVSEATLDRNAIDLEAVIVSLRGPKNPVEFGKEALRFSHYLERQSGVREVKLHGYHEIGMNIDVNSVLLASKGLTLGQLIQQVQQSNLHYSAGSYDEKSPMVQVTTKNSIEDIDDLKALPVLYPRLTAAPLGEIASIGYGVGRTPKSLARYNGEDTVILGIVPEHPLDILKWGESLKAAISHYKQENPKLQLDIVAFQPTRTLDRIQNLGGSLLVGVASVILVLTLWMGWRIGLVVALSVPMITLIGFGFYYIFGGVLHQISLAALLLSLGQFIDNVTVIAEGTQRKVDEGEDPILASADTANAFKVPMIFATGTAVASFLPLLSSQGGTAEFTFSIPLIATLTLIVSYFFAIYTTPLLCAFLLRPGAQRTEPLKETSWFTNVYKYPKLIVLGTLVIFALSATGLIFVKKEFFPWADRNEFTLSMELPEGTSIHDTDKYARIMETQLGSHPDILQYSTYVGQTTPYYYYSIRMATNTPHIAEFLITTRDFGKNLSVAEDLIRYASAQFPANVRLSQKQLKQGAPVNADVEYEVYGDDLKALSAFAHDFVEENQNIPGAVNLRTSAPLYVPKLNITLNESGALEKGFDRNQLAMNLLAYSQGFDVSHYFDDGERLPIRIALTDLKQSRDWESTRRLKVIPTQYRDYSLSELTQTSHSKVPTLISRKNGRLMISILSDLAPGIGLNELGPRLEKQIRESLGEKHWEVKVAGQAGESDTANLAIVRAIPFGLILLMICLLLEFRSFRKLLLVLATVALVSLGVTPGLLIGGQPFGFMSILGILALVGIVVNNAILIIEAIEQAREDEPELNAAIQKALGLRTRPILITTVMTLLGLLPLAFEKSTLWPPMAWAMISGLVISTLLSLFFLPASYELLFAKKVPMRVAPVAVVLLLLFGCANADARQYSLEDLASGARDSEYWKANENLNEADEFEYKGAWRASYMPKLLGTVERVMNDRTLYVEGFVEPVPYGKQNYVFGGLQLEQPVFNLSSMVYGVSSHRSHALSQRFSRDYENEKFRLELLFDALALLQVEEQVRLQFKLKENLEKQYTEVDRLYRHGKTGRGDLMKIEVEQVNASRLISELQEKQNEIREKLRTHFPDFDGVVYAGFDAFAAKAGLLTKLEKSERRERADISSLKHAIGSLADAKKASNASYLPVINLIGRYNNTQQGFLVRNQDWYSLSLQIQWSIFDGGVQNAESRRHLMQQSAAERQAVLLERERGSVEKTLTKDIRRLSEDERSYAQTEEKVRLILEAERMQYRLGKNTLNQVLETERLWIQQKSKYIESVFSQWRKGLSYLNNQGIEIDAKVFD